MKGNIEMRVLKLTKDEVKPVIATVIENEKNKSLYFNVNHGMRGKGFWSIVHTLNFKFFVPRTKEDVCVLDADNYILKPIMRNKVTLKDKRNNPIYCISIDNNDTQRNDILLFWEIPNNNYTDVKFEHGINASLLGKGYSGKDRGDVVYISPYPVLEIMGDCDLTWSAIDSEGKTISQVINVRINQTPQININPIKEGV